MEKSKKLFAITAFSILITIIIMNLGSALIINSVSISPNTIAPGETSTVSMSIKNNGDNDYTDVSVTLDFTNIPLAPLDSSSTVSFDGLDSGNTKEANFDIIASNNAASGIYKIPVIVKYTDNDVPKTIQSVISIMVNSDPIIDVNYDGGALLKGQNNKVSIKIVNKGLGDAKFLEVLTGSSTTYSMLSQNQIYIGDVNSNDYQTEDFSIFISQNSPSTINFPITVNYKDITNKEYSKDFNIQLKSYSSGQAQALGLSPKDNTIYIIIIVVVLIIIFFLYRMIRKRRKKKENQENSA